MIDVLIVGQGIAGTTLGRFLEQSGKTFRVVESGSHPAASRIAPGVWNPIAVKRFNKAWLADETWASAEAFYQAEEKFFGSSFYHTNGMLKAISNVHELSQMWQNMDELAPFVEYTDRTISGVEAPHGFLHIREAGYVQVASYLNKVKSHWIEQGCFCETSFVHADLVQEGGNWSWNGQVFRKVVFCEGISGRQNPYLEHLPLGNTKGQVLDVKIAGLEIDSILNKNLFILPVGEDRFRVGSTYEWTFDDLEPTEKANADLLEKLSALIPDLKVEVIGQIAGGRPTTRDRRPLMGELSNPGLHVFNGLGSRGVMLAPYLADCMTRFLLGDENAIPAEARVERVKQSV